MQAVRKYLRDWAEPEISFALAVEETYERVLVVPACREEASLLDRYFAAVRTSRGRTLCILVVNGADDASEEHHAENAYFMEAVIARLERVRELAGPWRAVLGTVQQACLDVLVVDRAREGSRLPAKQGVGLARKIGCDLGLALHVSGQVRSPFIFFTDADATLPEAFFDSLAGYEDASIAAAVFPFWHTPSADVSVSRATAFYEVSLRYYVEGLAWAGSPYAFHTLGSAMAVRTESYAAVRGMPKREAAEDFYLLNKLAKVGALARVPTRPIRIAARASDRTPFGTGRSVRAFSGSPVDFKLYSPTCFEQLRYFLARLEGFADHADVERFFSDIRNLDAVQALLAQWEARAALLQVARQGKTADARRSKVHTWFDGFRTLKLIHAVRDGGSPHVPWREAIRHAPFLAGIECPEDDVLFVALREQMEKAEAHRADAAGAGMAPGALGAPPTTMRCTSKGP